MTTIGSGSSHVYARPYLRASSRSVGWSVRRAFESALRLADRGLVTLMAWYEVAQERRALGSMSDEMLKDIGLSRTDARREAARWFWDTGGTR